MVRTRRRVICTDAGIQWGHGSRVSKTSELPHRDGLGVVCDNYSATLYGRRWSFFRAATHPTSTSSLRVTATAGPFFQFQSYGHTCALFTILSQYCEFHQNSKCMMTARKRHSERIQRVAVADADGRKNNKHACHSVPAVFYTSTHRVLHCLHIGYRRNFVACLMYPSTTTTTAAAVCKISPPTTMYGVSSRARQRTAQAVGKLHRSSDWAGLHFCGCSFDL